MAREIHNAVAGRLRHPPPRPRKGWRGGALIYAGRGCLQGGRTGANNSLASASTGHPLLSFDPTSHLFFPRILSVAVSSRVSINFVEFREITVHFLFVPSFEGRVNTIIENVCREEDDVKRNTT